MPVIARGYPGSGEVERGGVGAPPHRPEEEVSGEYAAVIEGDAVIGAAFFHLPHLRAPVDGDALRAHGIRQCLGDVGIVGAQQAFATDDDMALRTQRLQDARDFAGDITAADDDGALGLAFQGKEVVRGAAECGTCDVCGDFRITAGRDNDVLAAIGIVADAHGIGGYKARRATDKGNAAFVEVSGIDVVQAGDVGVAGFFEGAPAESGLRRDAVEETRGVSERLGGVRGVPEEFFRHAADVDAGAAEAGTFDDGDFRAVFGSAAGGRNAAGTAADTDEVEGLHGISVCLTERGAL